jgi:uncharacterized protein (UPF0333 family)
MSRLIIIIIIGIVIYYAMGNATPAAAAEIPAGQGSLAEQEVALLTRAAAMDAPVMRIEYSSQAQSGKLNLW